MKKLIRVSTVAVSLDILLRGQLSFLKNYFNVIAISGNDEHLKNVSQREKVKTIAITISRKISIINDIISLIKLYFIFKKEKPQIVHSITPKAGLLSMLAARLVGVPIRIHTFTGLIFPYRTGVMFHLLKLMDRITCRMATHIIPEGEGVKCHLLHYNITKKPIYVLANGNVNGVNPLYFSTESVPEKRQDLREMYSYLNTDIIFVFVGRLVVDKGIVELIDAFLSLTLRYSNIQLLLVGPFESKLDPLPEATLQTMNNHPKIKNVGFQEDIRPFLKMSDALVLPSYREGFPNVLLQAGAMGLPCVVTNISGCNEVIHHKENGLIVKLKDKNDLLLAMEELINNSELRIQLGAQSRPKICKEYTNDIVWNAQLEFYKKCINEKTIPITN